MRSRFGVGERTAGAIVTSRASLDSRFRSSISPRWDSSERGEERICSDTLPAMLAKLNSRKFWVAAFTVGAIVAQGLCQVLEHMRWLDTWKDGKA